MLQQNPPVFNYVYRLTYNIDLSNGCTTVVVVVVVILIE